jgi:hypothetical protein
MSRLPVRTTKVFRVIRTICALTPICGSHDLEHHQDRKAAARVCGVHIGGPGLDGNLLSR